MILKKPSIKIFEGQLNLFFQIIYMLHDFVNGSEEMPISIIIDFYILYCGCNGMESDVIAFNITSELLILERSSDLQKLEVLPASAL